MTFEVLDPTFDEEGSTFLAAQRVDGLQGATVGLVSNGKRGTVAFFDAVERELRSTFGVAHVERVTKANYSAPAESEIMTRAARWNALIAGIGD